LWLLVQWRNNRFQALIAAEVNTMNEHCRTLYYDTDKIIQTLQRAYHDCPHGPTEDLILSALQATRQLQQDIQKVGVI